MCSIHRNNAFKSHLCLAAGCSNYTYNKGSNEKMPMLIKWETIIEHIIDG